jgi:hypothetical protein
MNVATVPATDRYEANDIFAGACGTEDFYAGMLEQELLGVYPNPAESVLHVMRGGSESFEILDMQGRSWLIGNLNSDGTIEIAHLPIGVYLLRIGNSNIRFIKS